MSEKFYSLVTTIGQAQFANALALDQKVAFGTFAVGDGGGSVYDPSENQTDLKHEVWSGKITSLTIGENNPNELIVETYIPSNKGGFTIREFGIKDSDGNLLVVGKHPETYKPVAADGTAKDITLRVILVISNANEVILKIDPSVQVATRQDLDKIRADFDGAKGSLASKKDFEDFKTNFEEEKKELVSKDDLDTHKKDVNLHTTKEDKDKLKAIPDDPKYTDTTYTFDKGLSLDSGKVSANLGEGLDFDGDGKIKASDELARKSYVDEGLEKSAGTLTESLKEYVKKDGDKVLSSNDFTNAYKSNIDKNLRDEAEVMRLALKVARRDALFKSNELYKDLNNYYGTSISSSIRTIDQFQKSPTAMAQLLNNDIAKREMSSDLAYSRAIFEACMPYFKNNLAPFKENFKDELKAKAMLTSPKCINEIINYDGLLAASVDKNLSTVYYTQFCPYVFSITNEEYNIALLSGPTALSTSGLLKRYHETLGDIMILGTYDMGLGTFQDAIINVGDRLGNSINLTYDNFDNFDKRKKQEESGDNWTSYKYSYQNNHAFAESFYNFVKANGFVKGGFNKNAKYKFAFSFLNLNMLKRDLARGL